MILWSMIENPESDDPQFKSAWKNFVKDTYVPGQNLIETFAHREMILKEEYNVTYKTKQISHLGFATEQDLMLFLLRWS